MQFVTDFADQAVTLPLAVGFGLVLLGSGWRRGAGAWLVAGGLCWGLMTLLKLGFAACGPGPGNGALADPSGHTASGAFVYAGAATLLVSIRPAWAVAIAIAAVIGVSRVAVGAHSVPDVLAGGAVGVACVALLRTLAGDTPGTLAIPRQWVLASVVGSALLLHGGHVAAQVHLQSVGVWVFAAACAGP